MTIQLLEDTYTDPIHKNFIPEGAIVELVNKYETCMCIQYNGYNYMVNSNILYKELKQCQKD